MSEDQPSYRTDPPPPRIARRSRWRVSSVWLVPLVAVLIGIGLAVHSVLQRGPTVNIVFANAQGLTAGKTEVKYKNVVVGHVTTIGFDKGFDKVVVTVELRRSATRVARADSRFWVVRPRVDLGGVSGLGTLISGAYIDVDIGRSKERKTHFVGLPEPPAVMHDQQGGRFELHATDIGSLNIGAPVYYRRFSVGRVTGERLDDDGKGVQVDVFVRAPYDKLVHPTTRFWNASGFKVSVGTGGLKFSTQSLGSILAGGVAFGQRRGDDDKELATSGAQFTLYGSKSAALAPANGPPLTIRMRFNQSVRGLSTGAEVDFRGIDFGHVTAIDMHYDPQHTAFYTDVDAVIYLDRLGSAQSTIAQLGEASGSGNTKLLATLVGKGMRAQLRTANLISGQLYVALDFFPHASAVKFEAQATPVLIPTVTGSLEQLQEAIAEIVRKLNAVPFDRIGAQLSTTLANTNRLLASLNGRLAPQAVATLEQAQKTLAAAQHGLLSPRSPVQENAGRTLDQVRAAAQSLEELANYLRRHPDAVLRGRAPDTPPPFVTGGSK